MTCKLSHQQPGSVGSTSFAACHRLRAQHCARASELCAVADINLNNSCWTLAGRHESLCARLWAHGQPANRKLCPAGWHIIDLRQVQRRGAASPGVQPQRPQPSMVRCEVLAVGARHRQPHAVPRREAERCGQQLEPTPATRRGLTSFEGFVARIKAEVDIRVRRWSASMLDSRVQHGDQPGNDG